VFLSYYFIHYLQGMTVFANHYYMPEENVLDALKAAPNPTNAKN
jgi:hypothetical protein